MRYNFKRCSGREWITLIRTLRERKLTFLEVQTKDLYDRTKVSNVTTVYYAKSTSYCKLIYYDWCNSKWNKKFREINFSAKEIDPLRCVLTFRKIANGYGENIPYEPNKPYRNGIYTYYKKAYNGYVTVLDMNSAYLYALKQPLADWGTKQEVKIKDIWKKEYDYYSFENDYGCDMYYKEDTENMQGAILRADLKVYGYKGKVHYEKTANELYRLKKEVNKDRYKNVANIAIGCMHKRSGKQNNNTLAASLYAWFAWKIDDYVKQFTKAGYDVIMVTTDSIKVKGKYNKDDNLVTIGDGLGEFKVEYEGEAKYYSTGHYEEGVIKWKGKPEYMRHEGAKPCQFIDNLKEESKIYEKYAIK